MLFKSSLYRLTADGGCFFRGVIGDKNSLWDKIKSDVRIMLTSDFIYFVYSLLKFWLGKSDDYEFVINHFHPEGHL